MWRMKQSKLKHIYFVYFLYMQLAHYPHILCGKCAQCRKKQPFVHQPNFFEIGLVTVARGGGCQSRQLVRNSKRATDHDCCEIFPVGIDVFILIYFIEFDPVFTQDQQYVISCRCVKLSR